MNLTSSLTAAVLALWSLATGNNTMVWQTDYNVAVKKAMENKKPLAVFIGHGKSGQTSLITEGGIGESEAKALTEQFVSLYIDADSEAGKKLAASFDINEGVVISDRSGSLQAVLHEGTVTKTELNDYLTRYSVPTKDVTTTELGGRRRPIMNFITDPNRNRPVMNTFQNVGNYFSGST
ncbi:MAG: hypothetical protein U0798_04835 [Gemmataceae bacterium]